MGQIPTSQTRAPTGDAVADAIPGVSVVPVTQPARAMQNAAAALGAVAGDMQREQAQRDRAAAVAAAEAQEAALRAKQLVAMNGGKDALADLHDEVAGGVLDGTVPKEKAQEEFAKRSAKLLEGAALGLPQDRKDIVNAHLQGTAGTLGNSIRKTVTVRDRIDVTSGIKQTLEYLQRQYLADPGGSTKLAMDAVDQLGPHSTLNTEQLATMKQGWKESTQYTAAFGMVNASKASASQLDAAEQALQRPQFADLDPQRRAVLVNQIDGHRVHLAQKAEIAAARAERQAQYRLTVAKAEFDTAVALADKGVFSPEYFDRANAVTAGTPYNAGLRGLLQQTREVGALATMPLGRQRAELDALNQQIAANGISPELEKRRTQVEKVVTQSEKDYAADPMRAANERGVIQLKGLSLAGGIPGVVQQLGERVQQSAIVSQVTGKPVSPLTDQEAEFVKQNLETLPPKERSQMVSMLAGAVGPQAAQGLATQIDKQDRALALEFSYAGEMTTMGRRTSELIALGRQARKDGTSTKREKVPGENEGKWRAFAANNIGDAFADERTRNRVLDAAVLIAHAKAAEGNGVPDIGEVTQLAVGGSLIEHNGRTLPLPAGVDEDALANRLRSIKPEDLAGQTPGGAVRAGGVAMPVADFLKALPAQQLAPLTAQGKPVPGRYFVLVNGRAVTNSAGDPILIGVN